MGRTYPLRVDPSDEEYMREVATFVDQKMQAVRENFPGQPELTSAVIAALSIAEELIEERSRREEQETQVYGQLTELIDEIDEMAGDDHATRERQEGAETGPEENASSISSGEDTC